MATRREEAEGPGERRPSPRKPKESPIDILGLIRSGHLTGEIKPRLSPQELRSRIQRDDDDAAHERRKEMIILIALLIGIGAIFGACLTVALRPGPSEDKKWAMSILASIVSAGLGYITGRSSRAD